MLPAAPQDLIAHKIEQLDSWLEEHGDRELAEQAHLDDGHDGQVVWHHGYRAALLDLHASLKSAGTRRHAPAGTWSISRTERASDFK
jgi:hypothetical protein